jgi:pilus assembly protein Flp/PilA
MLITPSDASARRRGAPSILARFLHDASGATAIEYALIAVGISVAIVGAVTILGTRVVTLYTSVSTGLGN